MGRHQRVPTTRVLRKRPRYRNFRKAFLRKHRLCRRCLAEGRNELATDVHHMRSLAQYPEDLCDERYCDPLCTRCHRIVERGEGHFSWNLRLD